MIASKKAKRKFTLVVMFMLVVSLFAAFPAHVHAYAPEFLGAIGVPDPKATPIRTAKALADINNNLNGNFYLANDIDLAGFGNWVPLGDDEAHPFTGKFDGQGHIIKNMKVVVELYPMPNNSKAPLHGYAGLFGNTKNAELKNIGIIGAKINAIGQVYAGGVVGYYTTAKPLSNCFFAGEINVKTDKNNAHNYIGGIVGNIDNRTESYDSATNEMADCYNEGKITVASIYESIATATLHVGGIAGNANFLIASNCFNTGSIDVKVNHIKSGENQITVGGLIGDSTFRLNLTACRNKGNISVSVNGEIANLRVGGLTGQTNRSVQIDRCYNTGNVKAIIDAGNPEYSFTKIIKAGGLFGEMQNDPNFIASEGDVSITNSFNNGGVTALITGDGKKINYCTVLAGGIAGYVYTVFAQNTYNTGNVLCALPITVGADTNNLDYIRSTAGGFYGEVQNAYTPTKIVDCYNRGNVEAKSREGTVAYAGGFVGYLYNEYRPSKIDINTSYSAGLINAICSDGVKPISEPIGEFTHIGGFLGYGKTGSYIFSNSYYLKPAKGQAVGDRYGDSGFENVKALTQEQLKVQASFVGFDFKSIWMMPKNGGYPVISVR